MVKQGVWGLLLAACVVAGAARAGEDEASVDPVWGDYADLAGRSALATEGYRLRWYWAVPGQELVQEYRNPGDGSVAHREVITRGAKPGTLVLKSSALMKKQWNGTVQPDGRVLFIGKGLLKLPYVAGGAEDGTWQVRQVKLDGTRIASEEAVPPYGLFTFDEAVAAEKTPASAASRPVAAAAPVAAEVVASIPVAAAAPAAPVAAPVGIAAAPTAPADPPVATVAADGSGAPGTDAAPAATIQAGIFDPLGLSPAMAKMLVLAFRQDGDSVRVALPFFQHDYRRIGDGTFQRVGDPTSGLRIIDPQTVELTSTNNGGTSRRYLRRNGAGPQPQELRYGAYSIVGQDPEARKVLRLAGNTISYAEPVGVSDFVLGADGRYHSRLSNSTLRIIDPYTVEWAPSPGQPGKRQLLIRTGEASPDYVEESRRKKDQWLAEYEAIQAAEEEEWQAQNSAPASGIGVASIMGAFMRGLSDGNAANAALQRSMQGAVESGLAAGAVEYARREAERNRREAEQRRADVEHARRVREAEEAARQARLATAQRTNGSNYTANPYGGAGLDGGSASTTTDPRTCVTAPSVRPLSYRKNALEATVVNQCETSVDIRVCLRNTSGWKCGVKMGVSPGASMVHELTGADGQTFMDARSMGSGRPLDMP